MAAAERARLLVEQAEVREPPDDPLILFSALYAFWNAIPFNGDVCRGLAAQFWLWLGNWLSSISG
jgi:hypothetical protein